MSEVAAKSAYHRMPHMLSDAPWDCTEAASGLAQDAMPIDWEAINRACSLTARVLRKREKSAGVQRQWNGRHGKGDNCQVGAFEAIAKGEIAALIDARLYLPQSWIDEPTRCDEAGIPKDQQAHRSKGELAADIVRTARQNGLRFGFVGLDGEFGQLPWLLRDLADTGGETFMADVHCDQIIYAQNPCPHIPARKSTLGRAPSRLTSEAEGETVAA